MPPQSARGAIELPLHQLTAELQGVVLPGIGIDVHDVVEIFSEPDPEAVFCHSLQFTAAPAGEVHRRLRNDLLASLISLLGSGCVGPRGPAGEVIRPRVFVVFKLIYLDLGPLEGDAAPHCFNVQNAASLTLKSIDRSCSVSSFMSAVSLCS